MYIRGKAAAERDQAEALNKLFDKEEFARGRRSRAGQMITAAYKQEHRRHHHVAWGERGLGREIEQSGSFALGLIMWGDRVVKGGAGCFTGTKPAPALAPYYAPFQEIL